MDPLIVQESDEVYHGRKGFISSSYLKELSKSPMHYKHALLNPKEATPAMKLGTYIHALCLGGEINSYMAFPLHPDGKKVSSASKEYKAFEEANPGKKFIHPRELNDAQAIVNSFNSNSHVKGLMKDARVEWSVYSTDPASKMKLKAKPDIWGKDFIADLKTTGTMPNRLDLHAFQAQWDLQVAHYAMTVFYATGEEIKDYYIILMESAAPFGVKVLKFTKADIEESFKVWRERINTIWVCEKENHWPGYELPIIDIKRPAFLEVDTVSFFEEVV